MKKYAFILIALSVFLGVHSSTPVISLDSICSYELEGDSSSFTIRLTADSTIWGVQMILSVPKNMLITSNDIRLESTRVPQNKGYQLRSKMLSDTTVLIVISPSVAVAHLSMDTLDLVHVDYTWSEWPIIGHRYPIILSDILMISTEGLSTYTQETTETFFEYAEKPKYKITFLGFDGTILQSDSIPLWDMPVYSGDTPTKPATAQYSYTFSGWDRDLERVESDATYTAQFDSVVNQYTINVFGENCILVGEGIYDYGTEVILTVTPNKGYQFVEWSDGDTNNPRNIVVTENATYIVIITRDDATLIGNISARVYMEKFLRDGQILIQRGNTTYNLRGQVVK